MSQIAAPLRALGHGFGPTESLHTITKPQRLFFQNQSQFVLELLILLWPYLHDIFLN